MPNRKLAYDLEIDTAGAVSDLKRLGTAGKAAGKDLADGLTDAGTAGARALDALGTRLDGLESEFKGTASAVKAIGANPS